MGRLDLLRFIQMLGTLHTYVIESGGMWSFHRIDNEEVAQMIPFSRTRIMMKR